MGIMNMSFKPPIDVLNALENEMNRGFLGYYGGIESYRKRSCKMVRNKT